jgi:O-antigen/teichoic acid export membrane protein
MTGSDRAALARPVEPPSGPNLTGRASLNAVASFLEYGVRALVELVVSPLLVGGLGAAMYGAWRVLWQWSGYVWGASGRSAQALQFAIANRQWTATNQQKRELVGAAFVVWLLFVPILLAAGVLGVWLAPILLDVPADQVTSLRVAAAVLVLDALAVTVVTLPRSTLQGQNLGYARMTATPVMVAIGGGLVVLAVKLGWGLPGVAAATLTTTLLTGAVFLRITRRRLPWFGMSRPSRSTVRWFLRLSLWFLGWKFVLELMIASDVLVLAVFVPLATVAAFALTKFVSDSLVQALSLLVQATIPGIGGHVGAGRITRAAALRGEVLALVWVVGIAAGAAVVVWNATFIGLWVGEDLFAGVGVTLVLVVLALQIALIRTDTFLIDVALVPRVKVAAGSVSAVASIALAAIAIGPLDLGVVGMCVGLALGRAILGVAAPLAVGRILGISVQSQLRGITRPLVTTTVILGAAYVVAGELAVDSWVGLLLGVMATVPVAALVAVTCGLDRPQRRQVVARARELARQARRSR